MWLSTSPPRRSSFLCGLGFRRSLLASVAALGLALAGCASPSRSSEQYVVLESQKFT